MKAIIIGGGIIGLFSAYYLQKDGFEVTVLDKGDLATNCSLGNLGMVVPSHFIPLASPGIVAKGLKWLTDSKSPFYIKPSLSFDLMTWGLKFVKAANQKQCEIAAPYLRDYNLFSRSLYTSLAQEKDFNFYYNHNGILMYYHTEDGAKEEIHMAKMAQEMGLDVEILDKTGIENIEPNLKFNAIGAVHYKCDAHLNPNLLNLQLRKYLTDNGVQILANQEVKGFEISNNKINKVICSNQTFEAEKVILSAGSWMKETGDLLKINIPMMPGKGYTFNVENQPEMTIPSILTEARVAITPMGQQIRFGGTMELGKMDNKINRNRVEGIVNAIPKYFRNITLEVPKNENIWYGYRPCSPDGLPYLGYSQKYNNLIIAGGHSMMGLSLAPATGKMVAQLASNKKTEVNLSLFNPERYH